jgi:hypothetical protein
LQLSTAARFNVVLDICGQGGEITLAALIDDNDEVM